MFNSIKGMLTEKSAEFLYIDTHGIEWEIGASAYTLSKVGPINNEVKVYTFLQHREDAMKIFGFADRKERELFLELLKVQGLGAKQSMRILSSTTIDQFVGYLEDEDTASLSKIPGIGKKTSQKILLTLRGKLNFNEDREVASSVDEEIIESLTAMGFEKKRVIQVLKVLLKDPAITSLGASEKEQEIFKRAIVQLST